MGFQLLYAGFETCFGPSIQGAGPKTHLGCVTLTLTLILHTAREHRNHTLYSVINLQWGAIKYLLGYKISLPDVFCYPIFPNKIKVKTKLIGYQNTSGKLIL